MDEELAVLGLACLPSFGPVRLRRMLSVFPSAAAVWQAGPDELRARGVPSRWLERFCTERTHVDPRKVRDHCAHVGARFCAWTDDTFPHLLREMPDAPIGLFVRGTLPVTALSVAIVGTRRMSPYGRHVTFSIASDLARQGVTIVSGLALGIDGVAHDAAIQAAGHTIAVLACGIDRVYPRSHAGLARTITAKGGALVSEFPPGTPALKHHFPIRNRIIAGCASACIVTEAPESSGALLTAELALEYNREVFAVPGPITSPTSTGTHKLLKRGARLLTDAKDILEEYRIPALRTPAISDTLSAHEQTIIDCFSNEALTVDQIHQLSRLNTSVISATLTLLQIKGWVHQLDPLHFIRNR